MKTVLLLTIFLNFIVSQCIWSLTAANADLKFDTTLINYGNIPYGSGDLTSVFWFTNTGKVPVIITNCYTGDGGFMCPGYAHEREPVLPSKRGKITFRFDTRRLGPFNRQGTVVTNVGIFHVFIKGCLEAVPILFISEPQMNLGKIYARNIVVGEFEVSNDGTAPLVITRIEPIPSFLHNIIIDTVPVNRKLRLQLYFNASGMKDTFTQKWKLYTNAEEKLRELILSGKIQRSPLQIRLGDSIASYGNEKVVFGMFCANTGKDTIVINEIGDGCGPACLNVYAPDLKFGQKKVIAPNDTLYLIFHFSPSHNHTLKPINQGLLTIWISSESKKSKKHYSYDILIDLKGSNIAY